MDAFLGYLTCSSIVYQVALSELSYFSDADPYPSPRLPGPCTSVWSASSKLSCSFTGTSVGLSDFSEGAKLSWWN